MEMSRGTSQSGEVLVSGRGFLGAQLVKNPPTMWETWVRSLGWEDPLEEGMATHSSILAWRIPWTEHPAELAGGVAKSQTRLGDYAHKGFQLHI